MHGQSSGLELNGLHHALVRDQGHEAAVVGVSVGRGLARASWRVVGEGNTKLPALACLKRMDLAGHAVRDHPLLHGHRVEQCGVDLMPWGVDVLAGGRWVRGFAISHGVPLRSRRRTLTPPLGALLVDGVEAVQQPVRRIRAIRQPLVDEAGLEPSWHSMKPW